MVVCIYTYTLPSYIHTPSACMHSCMYACMHTCMYGCMYVCKYRIHLVCRNIKHPAKQTSHGVHLLTADRKDACLQVKELLALTVKKYRLKYDERFCY